MSIQSDLALITNITDALEVEHQTDLDTAWKSSKFQWIRHQPSATIGKIGRDVVTQLLSDSGFTMKGSGYSRVANGKRLIIRSSTGFSGGPYKFEQIRFEEYDVVFCLAMAPQEVRAWAIPKAVLFNDDGTYKSLDGFVKQHKGRKGVDTAWISVDLAQPPNWMSSYGGTINQALTSLKNMV